MLPPRTPGNSVWIAPVAFDLHERHIDLFHSTTIDPSSVQGVSYRYVELASGLIELRNFPPQRVEWNLRGQVRLTIEIVQKIADRSAIELKIVRKNPGVRQAQRDHAPQLRHQRVIAVAGVAKVIHPVEIVVHRVIDAVWAHERQTDGRNAKEIQENRMVGAAADAGVRQFRIAHGALLMKFRLARDFPFVVKALAGRSG